MVPYATRISFSSRWFILLVAVVEFAHRPGVWYPESVNRSKLLADEPNWELVAALEGASTLSKSAMWKLRRPIDEGRIFEGRELGQVLWSHCSTIEKNNGPPCRVVAVSDRTPLATGTRLSSVAHNALTNVFLHARPGRVEVGLDFEDGQIRLSVSDDGAGLPATVR